MAMILDTSTNAVTASVEAGDRPWGIGLSPNIEDALHRQRTIRRCVGD